MVSRKERCGSSLIDLSSGVRPNVEAERSVIGAILVKPDEIMPEAEEVLSEDDFLTPEYRTLFRTCSGYFVDGKPIDVVTLLYQHGDAYKQVIFDCIDTMPSTANWKAYAQIVIDTAKRYRAYEAATELSDLLVSHVDVQECQQVAVRVCEQLSAVTTGNTVSAKEGFYQFYVSLQHPVEYVDTGFPKIDRHTYIERGDFVVIGARPSVGKTALTLDMALHMAKAQKVAYFSLETKNSKLFARMAANLSSEYFGRIKSRSGVDYKKILDAKKAFEELDLHTVEAAGWTVAQIKAKAVQLGAEIIFVDYIGLIHADGGSRYEKMTNISYDLHTLAQQSKITVFGLSQLNRAGAGEPTMESLRESGQIEQDADIVLLLHAPEDDDPTQRKVIIAKNKEGQTGSVDLYFQGEYQRFSEVEGRHS